MNLADATALARKLDLPVDDHAVFGSGPLLVRGVIPAVNDIDVISRGRAWDLARSTGELVYLPEHDVTVASFFDGKVTVGTTWAIGEVDIDDAIDSAELVAGIPYVRLELVVAYKQIAGRPKDLDHLAKLATWMNSGAAGDFTTLAR